MTVSDLVLLLYLRLRVSLHGESTYSAAAAANLGHTVMVSKYVNLSSCLSRESQNFKFALVKLWLNA